MSDVKPGDLFIGVTDFFSILLPGAAATFIGYVAIDHFASHVPPDHFIRSLLALSGSEAWVAFAITSYILGHIVGSLGARIDELYDERKAFHRNHALEVDAKYRRDAFLKRVPAAMHARPPNKDRFWIANVVRELLLPNAWGRSEKEGHRLIATVARRLRGRSNKAAEHKTDESPQKLDEHHSDEPSNELPINAYKLARIVLSKDAPAIYAEVARLEADSKFFRSLVVVATFAVIACIVQTGFDLAAVLQGGATSQLVWGLVYLLLVIAILQISFARFCGLRLKATEAAFQGMLALHVQAVPTHSRMRRPVQV